MNINQKREKEIKIVSLMIHIYCKKHNDIDEKRLIEYATMRIQNCPRIETKTFCSQCHIHCYKKDRQQEIRKVMKYSGPRMIFYHPILAIKHLLERKFS
jgi:hypothetical protein